MLRRLNPVPYVKRRVAAACQRQVDGVKQRLDMITVPARFQGTVVEHWAKYWKYLVKDYFSVVFGLLKDAKDRPLRALVVSGAALAIYELANANPTEADLQQQLKRYGNEMACLPATMQNPVSRRHLIELERMFATGTIRRLDLGVASVFWRHDSNPELQMYQATCGYVGPDWATRRFVELGFLGRLWVLSDRMRDFDVNEIK